MLGLLGPIAFALLLAAVIGFGIINARGMECNSLPHLTYVQIAAGPHKGLCGKIVSTPWIGNGYHRRVCVNVPMSAEKAKQVYGPSYGEQIKDVLLEVEHGVGPRDWVWVGWRDVTLIPYDEATERQRSRERHERFFAAKYPPIDKHVSGGTE